MSLLETSGDITLGGQGESLGLAAPAADSSLGSTAAHTAATQNLYSRAYHRVGRVVRRSKAWMLIAPVDAIAVVAPGLWSPHLFKAMVATSLLTVLCLLVTRRYEARLHLAVLDDLPDLLRTFLAAVGLLAIVVALRNDQDALVDYLVHSLAAAGLLLVGRGISTGAINVSRRRGLTRHNTVLVGGGVIASELVDALTESRRYGLRVRGYVDNGGSVIDPTKAPRLGGIADLHDVLTRTRSSVVIIADGDLDESDVFAALGGPAVGHCDILIVPRLHHLRTHTGREDHIATIPVMRLSRPRLYGPTGALKRAFDATVAGVLLALVSPVLGFFALALRIESGPGVIFRQARIGRDGTVFDCLKLRSMRPVDEIESATNWNIGDDERLTALGRFIRRTSIDELPQLWNVLRGDMSLVGPRPERPYYVEQFSAQFEGYDRRHRMRVGLTGMAQVSGLRGDTSIADRARHDNYYIENWSLWLDVKILVRTVSEVLFAKGR